MRAARPVERYGGVAIALHWTIGALLLAQVAFGLLYDEIAPRGTPGRNPEAFLGQGAPRGVWVGVRFEWR